MATNSGAGERPRFYVGAYALCVRDRQMLLARVGPGYDETGMWTLPGGGLHFGEAPQDGVLRELAEETGLAGRVTQLAGIFSAAYPRTADRPREPVHHIGIVYFVETVPGEVRFELDGSTDLCAWWPLDDLAALPLVPLAEFGRATLEAWLCRGA